MNRKPLNEALVPYVVIPILVLFSIRLLHFGLTGQSNAELFANVFNPCIEIPIQKSAKMAIIRIDDIQAYSLEDISIKMMEDGKERGIPLSLGVIPKAIDEKTPIHAYLKANRCWVEMALHGFDHQGDTPDQPEFAALKFSEASAEIARGKPLLEALAQETITTFIPPLNAISAEARSAVAEAGIRIISSEGTDRFDYGATTFNFKTDRLNSPETVVQDCAKQVARTKACIIMMHPQDFITDGKLDPIKYEVYLDTLDRLKNEGYTFVRFKDLLDA